MKKIFIGIVLLIAVQSCLLTKPKTFTYLYDGINTGLDTLILMDGCYYNSREQTATLFYRDGMFIYSSVGRDSTGIYPTYTKGSGWDLSKGEASIYGRYIVKGDTILGQLIDNTFTDARKVYVLRYLIISKNRIKGLVNGNILVFVPIENRMDSTSWLFKKKWFYKKS